MTMTKEPATVHGIDTRYIISAVQGAGSSFFSRDAMRFFKSRTAATGYRITNPDGWNHTYVLVTSEPDFYGADRRYTVRVFTFADYARRVDRREDSAGFRGYATGSAARSAARRLARDIAAGVRP